MMFREKDKLSPFASRIWLSSPTMHGDELKYMQEAYETNWMSTVGANIDATERQVCEQIGCKYAVALSSGTAALHLAVKLAGERLYGRPAVGRGTLEGHRVFCSDLTFDATINPLVYEGGIPVLIDSETETWNMNPVALEKAFELYPEVRVVMVVNLYGTPAKLDEIRAICNRHGAILIEDAAESLGAVYKGRQTGTYGTLANVISFNGNKIITGSAGGMLLTDDEEAADRARKWSTQSREDAPWYQHEELGYNYRMSNVIAGVVRGQLPYLQEHIERKKEIYMRYQEGFRNLPVHMNPYIEGETEPNFWLSCILIAQEAMCCQIRDDKKSLYIPESGKSCPTEILETLAKHNAEGRPIWKPMHLQPIYRMNPFVTATGDEKARSNTHIKRENLRDVGEDIFQRGLCLPSDIKMTTEEQRRVIEIIKGCFGQKTHFFNV